MELILNRSRNYLNMAVNDPTAFMAHNAGTVLTNFDIKIDTISWRMAHVEVADIVKLNLLKILQKGEPIVMPFRTWKYYE